MDRAETIKRQALATRVAQRLSGPVENIIGFQTLIVTEMRQSGPEEAVADAETVLQAARDLEAMIAAFQSKGSAPIPTIDQEMMRHDLRTPMNAILGYSELLLEEWSDDLAADLQRDIRTVATECGHLLTNLDRLVDRSLAQVDEPGVKDQDTAIAAALERTLSLRAGPDRQPPGRILVVDDIAANRELMRRNLIQRDHDVTVAGSAQDAIRLLETQEFDMALVDILMPGMNGIELLTVLKDHPRWRRMAVVMVSGLKDVQAVVQCIKAGAEDYLQKPVDPVLMHARVDSCLEQLRWRERERQFLKKIEFEKSRADKLLQSMLPDTVIRRLGAGESVIADRFDETTIIFADIVGFTPMVARTDPTMLVTMLHDLFSAFDERADQFGIEKIKTIGDAYMAVAGVPVSQDDHAHRALEFARSIIDVTERGFGAQGPLSIRVGLNSGPVIAGLIGKKRFVYDVWGETVNLASRLETAGTAGRIRASEATLTALAHRRPAAQAQNITIKGVGPITTFLIE